MPFQCDDTSNLSTSKTCRICRICGELKPLDAFSIRKESGKRRSDCNVCVGKRTKAWRAENGERNNAQRRVRYAEPDCRRLEQSKEWNRAWRKKNPERAAAQARINHRTYKARKRGAEGSYTEADIAAIRAAQRDRCALPFCRKRLKGGGQIDHILALAKGGSNWPSNIQILCPACNSGKKDRDQIDYVQKRGFLI